MLIDVLHDSYVFVIKPVLIIVVSVFITDYPVYKFTFSIKYFENLLLYPL